MAVVSFQSLRSKLYAPTQRISVIRNGSQASTGSNQDSGLSSEWASAGSPPPGVAPTTAATCDRTLAGAVGQGNPAGAEQRAFFEYYDLPFIGSGAGGLFLLVDRLAHNGGLSGTVTTAQSNGAWPALPRYTDGIGVWAAIEIYTSIGATETTATMSYTNDAGTTGRTSQPVKIGSTGKNANRRLLPMSLQAGDKGVKAVASVTLAATTGTAGNFGVTLFKTLGAWSVVSGDAIPFVRSGRPLPNFGSIPKIVNDACLQLIYVGGGNAGTSIAGGVLSFFED